MTALHPPRSFPRKRESSPDGKTEKTLVRASAGTSGSKTVAAEIENWLTHLGAERRYSPKTLEAYRRDVEQFLDFLTEHLGGRPSLKDLTALTPADVRAFLAKRRAKASAAVR
jgi:Phage integrase, N-terminal SAM-like domain